METTWIIITIVLGVILFLVYASYSINAQIYMRAFCRKKTTKKVVALTFDDGPNKEQTPKIMEILRTHKATATFFCIGHQAAGQLALLQQMVHEGHLIANHSYSHSNWFPLYSLEHMKTDLRHCQQVLEEATGQPVTFFRPPFGVTNPTVAKAIKELGYTTIGWNIRSLDTQIGSADKVVQRIHRQLKPGSVILLHDRLPNSTEILTKTLQLLQKEGYTVVSLHALINNKI